MALEFINIDPKTGETLASVPSRVAEHTYLEHRIAQAQAAGQLPQPIRFYVAKLTDGVSVADLHHLRETRGIHAIGSNRRSAYFVEDEQTANWVKQELFTNHSDPVAYFSVMMSNAVASMVKPKARVLVIDDGELADGSATKKWGRRKPKDRDGNEVDPALLHQAQRMLGDGYCLVSPDIHRQVGREAAVEQVHQMVDQGKLSIAQVRSLKGAGIAEWNETETAELVAVHLEDVVIQAFNARTAFNDALMGDLKSPLQISKPKLEADSIRGEVTTVRWRYTDLGSNVTYSGRAMLERRPQPDGSLHLTVVGGTYSQRKVVAQTMDAIATSDLTPFQLRGGVSEWKGGFKGTSRAASICEAIGVDAILPKSAIKADGKTTPLGISEVSDLFWARKSDARIGMQRLGTQVLVNLPQGTEADILPKLAQASQKLMEVSRDPRAAADLYCQSYERRQAYVDQSQEYEEQAESAAQASSDFKGGSSAFQTRTDWLYQLLKVDAKTTQVVETFDAGAWREACFEWQGVDPSITALWQRKLQGIEAELNNSVLTPVALRILVAETLQLEEQDPDHRAALDGISQHLELTEVGGYGQILEMDQVVDRLNKFLQGQHYDIATGGVPVPSATAQPHADLKPGEICTTALPHGARVAAYRSPVANVGQMKVLVNNRAALQQLDPEAIAQVGVVYLNPTDAKKMVIDFDIDSVGLAPEEAYSRCRVAKLPNEKALQPGECHIPALPPGQELTLYHSHDQVLKLTNVDAPLPGGAPTGKHAVYLSPIDWASVDTQATVTYGYYDGRHGFKALVNEVEALTQPEVCPPAVEKLTKIPRDANHPDVAKLASADQAIAAQFTCLEQAMIHAADNPTGIVANVGMRLQALKQHLEASDPTSQIDQVKAASKKFQTLLEKEGVESADRHPFVIPDDLPDGYSPGAVIAKIAGIYRPETKPLKLIAQLEQQQGKELLTTIERIQQQFDRVIKGAFRDSQPVGYPDPSTVGGYDFKAEAAWIAGSQKFLNASSDQGKVDQAERLVVPRIVRFLDQLDQLPDDYRDTFKIPFTNYATWKAVQQIEVRQPQQDKAALQAVPTLRKLLEVVQHQIVDPQLQAAVETDKSARPVDYSTLTFAQSIASYQSVDWIKGKKREDAYLTSNTGILHPVPSNTHDPVGQIVAQTNRYYEQAEPITTAMKPAAYQYLVPKPTNQEMHQLALEIAQDYNAKVARTKAIEANAQMNPGVKLTIDSDQLPVPLTVTNLAAFDPSGTSPIWQAIRDQQPIYVQIAPNDHLVGIKLKESKAWKTQGSLEEPPTHSHQVIALVPDAEGRFKAYSVGTLENENARQLGRALIAAEDQAKPKPVKKSQEQSQEGAAAQRLQYTYEQVFGSSTQSAVIEATRLTLLPNYDKEMAKDILDQAETELREWADSIQPEDRIEAFRSLYHAHDQAEAGTQTASGGRLIAMRLFTNEMLPQLQQYSLTQGQVNGVHYNREDLGSEVEWRGQTVPVRAVICDNPKQDKIYGKAVWQVGIDEPVQVAEGAAPAEAAESGYQRNWYTIGTVSEDHCRPPIGAEAVAQIQEQFRYAIDIGDGIPLAIAADKDQTLEKLQGRDLSQPMQVSFKPMAGQRGKDIVVYHHPQEEGSAEAPIRLGRLEKKAVDHIAEHHSSVLLPRKGGARMVEAQVVTLPSQIAKLTLLPEAVERPQQWCKPTVQSWQEFTAQQALEIASPVYPRQQIVEAGTQPQNSQRGGSEQHQAVEQVQRQHQGESKDVPAPVSPVVVVSPEPAVVQPQSQSQLMKNVYQQRYESMAQSLQTGFALVEQRKGKPIEEHEKDQVITVHLLSAKLEIAEVIKVLSQSPASQAVLKQEGKQAMVEYIRQTIETCNASIKRDAAQAQVAAQSKGKGGSKSKAKAEMSL